jgi:amino acid adenylation domain-containing protein
MEKQRLKQSIKNNLAFDFYRHACEQGYRTALYVDERAWSYTEVAEQAAQLAGWLRSRYPQGGQNIGILSNRSAETYIGLLATLWSGNAYVPLNSRLPASYLSTIMEQAQLGCLVVDRDRLPLLTDPHFTASPALTLLSPLEEIETPHGYTLVNPPVIRTVPAMKEPAAVCAEQTAYIMFTSGSTGKPKGIAPTVANVAWFLEVTQKRYQLNEKDRLSQFNDLPWDPSVFDIFSAWKVGAATYVVPNQQLFAPTHFIRKHELTVWYSGPVQIAQLQRMKQLKPASLPTLRLSLFVGEPLLKDAAALWQKAALNSLVENVYGPTETTVVCLGQPFSDNPSCITPERGSVAIGTPYSGARISIIDAQRVPLADGVVGEIAIAGPMVTPGYWRAPELTEKSFVNIPGTSERWYLTGDMGYRTEEGVFHFMGRKDNQLQVHGVRVEPEEVECHLRSISASEETAVIGWPVTHGLVTGLAAFISPPRLGIEEIRRQLSNKLPSVMIPKRIEVLEKLPRNQNHKIDRNALLRRLEEQKEPT